MSLYEVEVIDLERTDPPEEPKGVLFCSICLEVVLDHGNRSIAKLQCGHEFHLDCIGSAFNSKGSMQCPNCRKIEKGQWLYASGHRPSIDFDMDPFEMEPIYSMIPHDLPHLLQWCPIRGWDYMSSIVESRDGGTRSNTHRSSASSSTRVCPFLAIHEFPHAGHAPPPSSTDAIPPASGSFHLHPSTLEGQLSGDFHTQSFSLVEPQGHSWQQQTSLSIPTAGTPDWPAAQSSSRIPRNEPSSHQRLGTFTHPHTFLHGPVASVGQSYNGEVRGHAHGHPSLRTPTRPRPFALFSSSPSSTDANGYYGFPLRGPRDGEGTGRSFDPYYGFGGEGRSAPLPWIPNEGEAQYWAPFDPNQNPPMLGSTDSVTRNFFPTGATGERTSRNHPESGYHHGMPPPYM